MTGIEIIALLVLVLHAYRNTTAICVAVGLAPYAFIGFAMWRRMS